MAPSVPEGNVVKSPMVGTFYIASSPEAAPFVAIGKNVEIGDTVCVIEAMKIMNPIESEVAGTVTAILVENGHPIEYDQPLFIIA
jgi:acetyl-CoA carboxylase biotin carboxyl carrier protein